MTNIKMENNHLYPEDSIDIFETKVSIHNLSFAILLSADRFKDISKFLTKCSN